MLATVETHLAKEIGPVARVLVAKYSKQDDDLASLEAHLEAHIPSVTGRFRFKKALLAVSEGMHHRSGADTTQAGLRTLQQRQDAARRVSDQRGAPTPHQVQAAGAKLAAYLGPIAHVIAKREAETAVDLDTLLQRLTEAIRSDADRNGFRAACRDIRRM
jgi:serine/threonine-protein kinase